MFGRLMPQEGKFFDLFNQHAALCVKGAQEMVGLMTNFDDLENRTHAVESIEKQADKITYEDALRNADSVNDLRLTIKLNGKESKGRDLSAGTEHLGLV